MNRMRRRWSIYYDNSRLEFSTLIGRKLTTNTMTAIAAEGQFLQQPNGCADFAERGEISHFLGTSSPSVNEQKSGKKS